MDRDRDRQPLRIRDEFYCQFLRCFDKYISNAYTFFRWEQDDEISNLKCPCKIQHLLEKYIPSTSYKNYFQRQYISFYTLFLLAWGCWQTEREMILRDTDVISLFFHNVYVYLKTWTWMIFFVQIKNKKR